MGHECCRYGDSIQGGWSGDQIMVQVRFPATTHTGPGVHPALHTTDNGSLSWGVKQLGQGVDHPPPSSG